MSKLEKKYGAWIYTSDRGHEYTIGQITAEYNVIIDEFDDIIDLFDTNVLVYDKLITYFYGDMNDDDTVKYVDKIIDYYEKGFGKFTFEKKKTTKTVYVSYSVLKTVEVPDDWNDREIKDYLEGIAPEDYNDMEYDIEED